MSIRHALSALFGEGLTYGPQRREQFEPRIGDVWRLKVGRVGVPQ
jgi:hypothetical protein